VKYAEYDREALNNAYKRTYISVGIPFVKSVKQSISKGGFDGAAWEAFFRSYVDTMMGPKVDGVLEFFENKTWDIIAEVLTQSVGEGWGYMETADAIMEQLGILDGQLAMRIARTETAAASNHAQFEVVKNLGYSDTMVKIWSTIIDNRTHETHIAMDGVSAGLNEQFVVGGYACQEPGDNSLPAQERDWCRCTLLYEFTDSEAFERYAYGETDSY